MKKKIFAAIGLLMTVVLAFGACAFRNDKLDRHDTDYVVLSNGGHAVQYGQYLYFINGAHKDYTDAGGDQNKWGEVEKGALYRVKLSGGAKTPYSRTDDPATTLYVPGVGTSAEYPFKSGETINAYVSEDLTFPFTVLEGKSYAEDEDDAEDMKYLDLSSSGAKVERVVPKIISYSNDAQGGVFIYDDWIYYATPNNRKDKQGNVQYTLTEFYRIKIDGQGNQLIYRSEEAVSAYNVYKYNGKTYLTVHEGSRLLSVPMTDKKVQTKVTLEWDVKSVYFPLKETYYKGMPENTLSDFVFYTRDTRNEDTLPYTGESLEMRRPDLAEYAHGELSQQNSTYAVIGVYGNTLFYNVTSDLGNDTKLVARDYTDIIEWTKGDESPVPSSNLQTVVSAGYASGLTQPRAYLRTSEPTVVGAYGGKLMLFRPGVTPTSVVIAESFSGQILYVYGSTVYYTTATEDETTGSIFSVEISESGPQRSVQLTGKTVYLGGKFGVDVAADMLFFIADSFDQTLFAEELREGAGAGMYVKKRAGASDITDEYFIGKLAEIDLPEEED